MKKGISLILICVILVTMLCSCNNKAFTLDTSKVTKIALTSNNGGVAILDSSNDIQTILTALAECSGTTTNKKVEELKAQYSFTTYSAEETALNTVTVYSNEYLQLDTVLYKGDYFSFINTLSPYCKANEITEISEIFKTSPSNIEELAFYNVTKKTFKIITKPTDIKTVHSFLNTLTITNKECSGEITEQFKLYFRLKGETKYSPAIEITHYENGSLCQSNGKSTLVNYVNWNILYEKMFYNTMPIK